MLIIKTNKLGDLIMAGFIFLGAAALGGVFAGGMAMEKLYPAQTGHKQIGEKIHTAEGEKIFIGYTGVPESIARKIKEEGSERCLFTTKSKAEAQQYAITGTVSNSDRPVVMAVYAKKFPKSKHCEPQWFEGPHAPISVEGQRKLQISIHEIEPVTTETRLGWGGAIERMRKDFDKK